MSTGNPRILGSDQGREWAIAYSLKKGEAS